MENSNTEITYIVSPGEDFRGAPVDILDNGNIARYSNCTLDDLQKQYNNNLVTAKESEFKEKYLKPYYDSLQKEYEEISEDRYYTLLEVLPPLRWYLGMFWMMEAYTGTLHTVVIEHNKRYFSALRDMTKTNEEIRKEFLSWYESSNSTSTEK